MNMRIGILARLFEKKLYVPQVYLDYFKKLGFQVDIVTLDSSLDSFDLFVLTGGYDLDPKYYNQINTHSQFIEEYNDTLDFKILDYATSFGVYVLGICRGMQSINVYFGGSLNQNILHHQNNNHFIKIKEKYLLTNSFHHQSIQKLGKNLTILAKSLDNEIEMIQSKNKKIIGVQFHPERMNTPIIDSIIFSLFNEV